MVMIYINDQQEECKASKFANAMKIDRRFVAMRRVEFYKRLGVYVETWQMKFKVGLCEVLFKEFSA